MNKKIDPFQNKGNAVSESEIKNIVNHPGGEYGPFGDHTQVPTPPTKKSKE